MFKQQKHLPTQCCLKKSGGSTSTCGVDISIGNWKVTDDEPEVGTVSCNSPEFRIQSIRLQGILAAALAANPLERPARTDITAAADLSFSFLTNDKNSDDDSARTGPSGPDSWYRPGLDGL